MRLEAAISWDWMRVLVIRWSALGDVILTEPVARAVRAAHADAVVELVTDPRYVGLMERGSFDVVHPFRRKGDGGRVAAVQRFAKTLQAPYDLVVDLQGKLQARHLSRAVRAKRRLTFVKRGIGAALLSLVGRDAPLDSYPQVDLYLRVLEEDGRFPSLERSLRPPRLTRRGAPRSTPRLIGLAPCATHATKLWPLERFAQLADHLAEGDPSLRFVTVTGPGEGAAALRLQSMVTRAEFLPRDLSALDVNELADVIETFSLLVSVDTGPAHLAAALSVPTVVLFGPTSSRRWGPLSGANRVVQLDLECSPCSNKGEPECPLPGAPHDCMKGIEAAGVVRVVREMLGG